MNRLRAGRWILMAVLLLTFSTASFAQVFVSVRIGPPALPVYAQPICPGAGYIWTPGYWAWNDDEGYYWVPGTWVLAPVGMYWTPGYWGWNEGFYVWHGGYWGPHIGFYGGINYGYGYTGVGFWGGEWRGGRMYYNRSVTNVNVTNVTNVYNKTVIVNNRTHVSYNGGTGGVRAQATQREMVAEHEHHREPLADQMRHQQEASHNRQLFARENHGRPAIAATVRPADFRGHDVIAAKAAGASYRQPTMSPREARGPAQVGNRPANAPNAKENGNRSFSPPRANENRNRPSDRSFAPPSARNNERANPKANDNSRPFAPPSANRTDRPANPMHKDNANSGTNPMYEGHRNGSRESAPAPSHESHPQPQHESRPQPQHESRPQPESRLQHESRPAPAHDAAPRPSHQNAPPRQEKPSKQEHNPGRGR